ncbi:FG-GAP-like repeat-containing protein [Kitasatospora sp. NPDC101155]|uniref:FG-GAP-like repeat-containing protein n=1 Tax=Kitasatospora sp. NPDC101155 TaxID=3364097 RepID=UPI0038069E1E
MVAPVAGVREFVLGPEHGRLVRHHDLPQHLDDVRRRVGRRSGQRAVLRDDRGVAAANGNTALAEVLAPRPAPTSPSHTFSQTTAGAFHGKGIGDLVARDDSDGHLYEWAGLGDGSFTARADLTAGWGPFSQTVAGDFRGSGHADLMAREDATGNLYMWPGNGDGTFAGRVLVTDGWGPFSQTVAGTFRDTGRADLIARNDTYGVLDEWMNTGGASFSHAFRLTDGW